MINYQVFKIYTGEFLILKLQLLEHATPLVPHR